MPPVTIASMFKLESGNKVQMPGDFVNALMPEGSRPGLLIFSPKTKTIRFFETMSDSIYKVEISIRSISPNFIKKMTRILKDLGLTMIYSTGFCFTASDCTYEGYIDSGEEQNANEALGELEKRLMDLGLVSKITSTEIKVE